MSQLGQNLPSGMGLSMPGPQTTVGPNAALHGVGGPISNPAGGPPSLSNALPGQVGHTGGPSGPGGPGIGALPPGALQNPQQGLMVSHPNAVSAGNSNTATGPQGGGASGAGGGPNQPGTATSTGQGALERQLEAERQQNLLKIQQLQESLQAAQQKDMQLKAAQEHQKQQTVHSVRQVIMLR